jgi:hypothetical protein
LSTPHPTSVLQKKPRYIHVDWSDCAFKQTNLQWLLREQWELLSNHLHDKTNKQTNKTLIFLSNSQEVEEYFEAHPFANAQRTVKQAIEGINTRASWLSRSRDDVSKWFGAHHF